jgi:hypothetical protein
MIGTDINGTGNLGNTSVGILINTSNNQIGGVNAGEGNIIANSGTDNIAVTGSATGVSILGNSIYASDTALGDLGIDLDADGVTANDPGDGDTGPNDLLNFPVITSATESGGIVTLAGVFDVPAGDYRFEFFKNPSGADPSGYGEGEVLIASSTLAHTGSGEEPFGAAFPGVLGEVITATLTMDYGDGTYGSSSEFSEARTVVIPRTISGLVFEDADFAGTASGYDGGVNDLALANVDVEIYDGTDAYLASTVTALDGTFSLPAPGDGNYKIRVRSATLGDADTQPAAGLNFTVPGTWPYPLAEMTWGNGVALVGGQDPGVDDTATGDNAGPGDTYVTVTVSGADVSGMELGFNYEVIVNEDDDANADNLRSKQGTLRQFIKNSNAILGTNKSWFQIPGI